MHFSFDLQPARDPMAPKEVEMVFSSASLIEFNGDVTALIYS